MEGNGGSSFFTISREQLIQKWNEQEGRCALSGFPMTHIMGQDYVLTNASVDRIKNDGPYSNENTRLVCRIANQMKFRLSDSELLEWCEAIVRTIKNHPTEAKRLGLLGDGPWNTQPRNL